MIGIKFANLKLREFLKEVMAMKVEALGKEEFLRWMLIQISALGFLLVYLLRLGGKIGF